MSSSCRSDGVEVPAPAQFTVNGAVVAGECYCHLRTDLYLVAYDDRALFAGTDGENCRVRWIDHGCEFPDAEHSEIGNRRRAALIFMRRKPALTGTTCQILHLERNLRERLPLGVADDGREEAAFDRYRHADIG